MFYKLNTLPVLYGSHYLARKFILGILFVLTTVYLNPNEVYYELKIYTLFKPQLTLTMRVEHEISFLSVDLRDRLQVSYPLIPQNILTVGPGCWFSCKR